MNIPDQLFLFRATSNDIVNTMSTALAMITKNVVGEAAEGLFDLAYIGPCAVAGFRYDAKANRFRMLHDLTRAETHYRFIDGSEHCAGR